MVNKEDLLEKSLELHKGLYIFNPGFWKNLIELRKQLNYHPAILKEITFSPQFSEEEEIRLIKQILKKAQGEQITSDRDLEVERFEESLKENLRRKRRGWRRD